MPVNNRSRAQAVEALVPQLKRLANDNGGYISESIVRASKTTSPLRVILETFGSLQAAARVAQVKYNPTLQAGDLSTIRSIGVWRSMSDEYVLMRVKAVETARGCLSIDIISKAAREGKCPGYNSLLKRFKASGLGDFCRKYGFRHTAKN